MENLLGLLTHKELEMNLSKYAWRKTTDINRSYAIFELTIDDVILLDIGLSDNEIFEISFHEGISNQIFDWGALLSILDEGKRLAEIDR